MTGAQRDAVLVAYGSRLGSTAEIAEFIGRVLAEDGAAVDVKAVADVGDLGEYDRVFMGSAIRYDRWLRDASRFVSRHRDALSAVPVALFFTCLAVSDASPKGAAKGDVYARKVSRLLPGIDEADVGRFAGVLDPSGASWAIRLILRLISRVTGVQEGDYRDWNAIREWTREQSGRSDGRSPRGPSSS